MERMRRDIKERARKRAVGEIIDVESGLEENEDDRKCMKELATVDHIKMDNLVEPSSNNNFFGPSSNDGSTDIDPSLSATTLPPITVATLSPTTTVTGTMSNSTKVVLATDLTWVRKRRALEGATADRKSPAELEHPFKTIPSNPELANKLGQKPSKLFLMMQATAAGCQQTILHFSALGLVPIMIMSLLHLMR